MLAYDIDILKRPARRGAGGDHGWCFGLPPGIAPHHWPLAPTNGYPLMHGFTLLLPEDYRCHGPEIVAVSFFASAFDHNDDGGPEVTDGVGAAMASAMAPDDPALLPFWEAARRPHPRLHRMLDCLNCDHAAILLTREEFEGQPCPPPPLVDSPLLASIAPPRWLKEGSASVFWDCYGRLPTADAPEPWVHATLGGQPERDPIYDRALHWRPRVGDPNGGRKPRSFWGEQGDYEQPFSFQRIEGSEDEKYVGKSWAADLPHNHIGGTMQPSQDVPDVSPYYIEFDEIVGGYNFGGGNAQLDFRDMKFDWACG